MESADEEPEHAAGKYQSEKNQREQVFFVSEHIREKKSSTYLQELAALQKASVFFQPD